MKKEPAETAAEMLQLWIKSKGDIAETTSRSKQVEEGVELEDVIAAISLVATEENIKPVGL